MSDTLVRSEAADEVGKEGMRANRVSDRREAAVLPEADQAPDPQASTEITSSDEAGLTRLHESTEADDPMHERTTAATTQDELIANKQREANFARGVIANVDETNPDKSGSTRMAAVDSLRAGAAIDRDSVQDKRKEQLERIAAQKGPGIMTAEALDKDLADQGVTPKQVETPKGPIGRFISWLAGDSKKNQAE